MDLPRVVATSALSVAALAIATACTNPMRSGSASACYRAAGEDPPEDAFIADVDVTHVGVRLVPEGDEAAPPEDFTDCAQGLAVAGELVDEDGAHFWLAVDAILGGTQLLPVDLLSVLDGGEVQVRQWRGWSIADNVFLRNGDQPVLALQNNAELEGEQGALRVEDAGADALPFPDSCGSTTSHALRFVDDNGAHGAGNGGAVELVVGGVELLAYNLHSREIGVTNCEDGPTPGLHVTWVAFDNSL